ncbi:helix-turn-helix transcriptional regulator [Streptomyces sp. SID8352]|uniref:helix-turn-helix domain-containing protein n=1 Tax=Streptomyces sp. SID8352 TaxID=2690338 RepID=UPI0019286B0A|nr:helix-turn-helix transcriptional regulator [Streptomyces sp. SID8352]
METTTKLGSVGQRVAKEIARLRGRTTVRELSARLGKLGRPILPSGITKIEQGKRRVDVDDLVALSVALQVTPTRLLMGPPPTEGPDDPAHEEAWEWYEEEDSNGEVRSYSALRLASELALDPWDAWTWAQGDFPLGEIWRLPEEESFHFAEDAEEKFKAENQLPVLRPLLHLGDSVQGAITAITAATMDALDKGLTDDQVEQLVKQSIRSWSRESRTLRANAERLRKAQEQADNEASS